MADPDLEIRYEDNGSKGVYVVDGPGGAFQAVCLAEDLFHNRRRLLRRQALLKAQDFFA